MVHRVVMPVTGAVSWTVLDDDGAPLEPVESYLAHLAALERSPNTQRAYATSLKLWFEFLARIERSWVDVDVDDVARFVSWLRAPADNVVVLDAGEAVRSAATVNRHLPRCSASTSITLASVSMSRPGWSRGAPWVAAPTSRCSITSPRAGRSRHGRWA